ncbi:hypothetical protein [Paraburkholderia sp. 32]
MDDTAKNTDAFDGYLKNVVFAYNYISTGDDRPDVAGFFAVSSKR